MNLIKLRETLKNKDFNAIKIFAKAQMSAFVGGITDYLVMIFFTEVFNIHYTISIVIGGVIGAVVNFSINNKWSFNSPDAAYKHSIYKQLTRFVLVAANSIFLKSTGTYLACTLLKLDYKISRIIIDLFVSIAFNYTLQRFWVFKKTNLKTD